MYSSSRPLRFDVVLLPSRWVRESWCFRILHIHMGQRVNQTSTSHFSKSPHCAFAFYTDTRGRESIRHQHHTSASLYTSSFSTMSSNSSRHQYNVNIYPPSYLYSTFPIRLRGWGWRGRLERYPLCYRAPFSGLSFHQLTFFWPSFY